MIVAALECVPAYPVFRLGYVCAVQLQQLYCMLASCISDGDALTSLSQ